MCCGCNCEMCESPVEYAWRRRRVELADLLTLAIERELTPAEREVIEKIYYENLTVTEVAAFTGKTYQAVRKALKNAQRKLREKLEYVTMYISNSEAPELVPLKLREAQMIAFSKGGNNFSKRIKNERTALAISGKKLSEITGISAERLEKLENGSDEPRLNEIKKLCCFFGIKADEIMNSGV